MNTLEILELNPCLDDTTFVWAFTGGMVHPGQTIKMILPPTLNRKASMVMAHQL